MGRHAALSLLLVCLISEYTHGGSLNWDDSKHDWMKKEDWDMDNGDHMEMTSDYMSGANSLVAFYPHDGKGKDIKHQAALHHLSAVLKESGASEDYTPNEWKELLKHIIFSHENRKDKLIDLNHENTMKVHAKFRAPEMEIHLCGLVYTLPEVHETISMEGEELVSASIRSEPEVHITDLHGNALHDGLHTMIWIDRAGDYSPFICWMLVNIPGSDVSKGDIAQAYLPFPESDDYQVFVYEQNDVISDDFAIMDYIQFNNCRFHHRCYFRQAEFVEAYDLHQRFVGHITVYLDPHSVYLGSTYMGLINDRDACVAYLDVVIPAALEYYKVNTDDKMALKKALYKYTAEYISHAAMEDEHSMYLLKAQYTSLVNKFVYKYPTDTLVPHYVEFLYDVGLWFKAEATSVGPLCSVMFDLPDVDRRFWLKDDKWDDGEREEVLSSETRNVPMVKIIEREHMLNKRPGDSTRFEDKLFTLLLVDRTDVGEALSFVVAPNNPYIYWMVVNIKGGDIATGNVVIPYTPWPESTKEYLFLYEQEFAIIDMPMAQYTSIRCRAENRCGFEQARFVWDYDLGLVGAGRYDTKKDVYGYLYEVRRGNNSPNKACEVYMAAKKSEEKDAE